jgi:hypothetical protein
MPASNFAIVPHGPAGLVPLAVLNHPATARFLDAVIIDAGLNLDREKAVAIGLAVIRRFEDGQGAQVIDLGRDAGYSDLELDVLVGAAVSCFRPAWLDPNADLPPSVEFSFAFAPELRP